MNTTIDDILKTSKVIPVITIQQAEHALPLAEALLNGGLKVLEITLRTPLGLEAISTIKAALPELIVGAGTVTSVGLFNSAQDAGADFLVSPGATPALIEAAKTNKTPYLPAASSPSEVMTLLEHDLTSMKFFPAEACGGVAMLKALAAPLSQAVFCPTGGITLKNSKAYLDLTNVVCVGGSWMVTEELLNACRWSDIQAYAQEAAKL